MERVILINATSCAGGGIKILDEFIAEIIGSIDSGENSNTSYYIFAPDQYKCSYDNLNLKVINNSNNNLYKSRNYWNLIGFKKWVKINKLRKFDLISLQNYFPKGANRLAQNRILYLHQSIPFHSKKWGVLSKKERRLWFYKHIYYQLIKKSVKNADKVIVQTEWFKSQVSLKLRYELDNIIVKRPKINTISTNDNIKELQLGKGVKLFYPAGGMIYKNHEVLISSMDIIVNEWGIKNVYLYFTIDHKENDIVNLIKKYNLEENIIFTGQLSFDEVIAYYISVDMLLFPSEIESFGLPLVEAQNFKLPIVCNDIELFKEVIGEYEESVQFCDAKNPMMWANAIKSYFFEKGEIK